MKLIRLELLNLASLDRPEGEVIDFEEGALRDSTIFSIIGPTGSGKSTLLDAICLALYGLAPRYPRRKGERNGFEIFGESSDVRRNRIAPTDCRNILTRGKKQGYSKLTFLADNGNLYRAEWHVRFRQKSYDNAETRLYVLTQENGQLVEQEAQWSDLPNILGLDFEQFLRTVLIAQGTFASFLNASEDERFLLLEKLIGCEGLYSNIIVKIKEQRDLAIQNYNQIAGQLKASQDVLLSDEQLAELQQSIARLEVEDRQVHERLNAVIDQLKWYSQEEQFLQNIDKYQAAHQKALQALSAIQPQAEQLHLHDTTLKAVDLYKDILEAQLIVSQQQAKLQQLQEQQALKQKELDNEKAALLRANTAKVQATTQRDAQQPHINQARILKGQLQQAQTALGEKRQAQRLADKALAEALKALADNSAAIDKATEQHRAALTFLEALHADFERNATLHQQAVAEATAAFKAADDRTQGLNPEVLQQAVNAARQQQTDLTEAIRLRRDIKQTADSIQNNQSEAERLTLRNAAIDQQLTQMPIADLQAELQTLQKTYTLMTSENWQQHRSDLQEGHPCPLCGATHHPYATHETFAPVADEMADLIRGKQQQLEQLNAQADLLNTEKNRNLGTISANATATANLQHSLDQKRQRWTDLHGRYPDWPEQAEQLEELRPAIDLQFVKADEQLKDYNQLQREVNRLRIAKETAERAQQAYKEKADRDLKEAERKLSLANTTLQTEQGKTANLTTQRDRQQEAAQQAAEAVKQADVDVQSKKQAIRNEIGDQDPDTFEQQLNQAVAKAEADVNNHTTKINGLDNALVTLTTEAKTASERKSENENLLARREPELEQWLRDFNASTTLQQPLTREEIAQLSAATDDWEAIRLRLNELRTAETAALTTLRNEQDSHQQHQHQHPEVDKQTLTDRKAELEQHSNEELVQSKARLTQHLQALQLIGDLDQQRRSADQTKTDWDQIYDAVGSDGKTLRKIAQCYTLRFLVEHANVEIRKFNSRYELQHVSNSLAIRVIDHDRADIVRETSTLSGGETFIVSLGLALGLSSLSSNNISFKNLFIDEGFGTLDPDTLAVVIDSLAMLQSSQGKKVGVISHTDTMSERITTQIRVIKNGASGSSRIEIYP